MITPILAYNICSGIRRIASNYSQTESTISLFWVDVYARHADSSTYGLRIRRVKEVAPTGYLIPRRHVINIYIQEEGLVTRKKMKKKSFIWINKKFI